MGHRAVASGFHIPNRLPDLAACSVSPPRSLCVTRGSSYIICVDRWQLIEDRYSKWPQTLKDSACVDDAF